MIQSKSNKNCDKGRQECLNCSCLPVSTQPIRSHELTELLLKCKMVFIIYAHICTSMKMRDLPFLHEIRFFAHSYCCLCIGWYSRICLYWVISKQAVNVQFSDMNSDYSGQPITKICNSITKSECQNPILRPFPSTRVPKLTQFKGGEGLG